MVIIRWCTGAFMMTGYLVGVVEMNQKPSYYYYGTWWKLRDGDTDTIWAHLCGKKRFGGKFHLYLKVYENLISSSPILQLCDGNMYESSELKNGIFLSRGYVSYISSLSWGDNTESVTRCTRYARKNIVHTGIPWTWWSQQIGKRIEIPVGRFCTRSLSPCQGIDDGTFLFFMRVNESSVQIQIPIFTV